MSDSGDIFDALYGDEGASTAGLGHGAASAEGVMAPADGGPYGAIDWRDPRAPVDELDRLFGTDGGVELPSYRAEHDDCFFRSAEQEDAERLESMMRGGMRRAPREDASPEGAGDAGGLADGARVSATLLAYRDFLEAGAIGADLGARVSRVLLSRLDEGAAERVLASLEGRGFRDALAPTSADDAAGCETILVGDERDEPGRPADAAPAPEGPEAGRDPFSPGGGAAPSSDSRPHERMPVEAAPGRDLYLRLEMRWDESDESCLRVTMTDPATGETSEYPTGFYRPASQDAREFCAQVAGVVMNDLGRSVAWSMPPARPGKPAQDGVAEAPEAVGEDGPATDAKAAGRPDTGLRAASVILIVAFFAVVPMGLAVLLGRPGEPSSLAFVVGLALSAALAWGVVRDSRK